MTIGLDEYKQMDVIDHGADYMFITQCYDVLCIFFDYPDTPREQVKFIIQLMSDYWNTYWGYSDVYMYRFDSVQYVPMYDHIRNLVAAAHDISGLSFWLKHCDHKRSFQYEGKELLKLKTTITNALPDNSWKTYGSVSKIIDQMVKIRKRRIKNYKHCGDETGADVKWRPIHESILDDIERSDTKHNIQADVQPDNKSLTDYKYLYVFCAIG